MDAPPEKEDCHPFVQVAALFHEAGAHVPEVIAQDLAQGFLLLSDLGSTTYLSALQDRKDSASTLSRRQPRARGDSANQPARHPSRL
jgi:aminoglycoside/choline kinase family phosphotransferase